MGILSGTWRQTRRYSERAERLGPLENKLGGKPEAGKWRRIMRVRMNA